MRAGISTVLKRKYKYTFECNFVGKTSKIKPLKYIYKYKFVWDASKILPLQAHKFREIEIYWKQIKNVLNETFQERRNCWASKPIESIRYSYCCSFDLFSEQNKCLDKVQTLKKHTFFRSWIGQSGLKGSDESFNFKIELLKPTSSQASKLLRTLYI